MLYNWLQKDCVVSEEVVSAAVGLEAFHISAEPTTAAHEDAVH